MTEVKSLFYINIFTGCVRQFPVMVMFLLLICAEVNLSTLVFLFKWMFFVLFCVD